MSFCILDHGRTSSLRPEGYAMVGIPGVRSRCTGLHRLVFAKKQGVSLADIKGTVVRHTCDNPRCINPDHLIGGSLADNNKDRAERGRSAKLVPSRQRLTEVDVLFIRANWLPAKGQPKNNPNGTMAMATLFKVDPAVIGRVIKGTYCVLRT